MLTPLSTERIYPVVIAASSQASRGHLGDVDWLAQCEKVAQGQLADVGVRVTDGAMALTLILCGAHSMAINRVREAMPPLAAV